MKIQIDLNGVKVERNLPIRWEDITFEQLLKLEQCKDDTERLSLFTGVDVATLKVAKIGNLEGVITCLSFLTRETEFFTIPTSCMGYDIPKDLAMETIGQYQDLKLEASTMINDVQSFEKYAHFCAIFACKPYDYANAEKLIPIFMQAPCTEVMAIGNFTLLRLAELTGNIPKGSLSQPTRMKRYRQAFKTYLKRLVFTVRFYIWKRKLRLTETSSSGGV